MNLYFIWFSAILLFFIFFYNKKYSLLSQPSIHFLILNIISVFVCDYVIKLENRTVETISLEKFYMGVYLCSIFSIVKYSKPKKEYKNTKKIKTVNLLKKGKIIKYICIGGVINFLIFIYFLLALNLDVVLLNYHYLELVNVKSLGIQSYKILVIYQKLLVVNGFLSFFLYGLLQNMKSKVLLIPKMMYFIIGSFALIYQLANNSRSTGLIIMGLLIPFMLFEKKSLFRTIKIGVVLLAILVSYKSVIYGRAQVKQGITQIPKNISKGFGSKSIEIGFAAQNIFGGATIFNRAKNLDGRYPIAYKILSFSPFPSVIDNFSKYNKYQNRINYYEPYNANVEVYHFGFLYGILYFFMLTFGLKIINNGVRIDNTIGLFIAFPAYLFFISYQQYPLRTSFRFFIYSVLLSYLYIRYKKRKKKKENNNNRI